MVTPIDEEALATPRRMVMTFKLKLKAESSAKTIPSMGSPVGERARRGARFGGSVQQKPHGHGTVGLAVVAVSGGGEPAAEINDR
jgi:hypothetical protein